jgi:leucyl aminopeptidase
MKIVVTTRSPKEVNTDLLVIPLPEKGVQKALTTLASRFRLRGDHARRDFAGKEGQALVLYGGKSGPKRIAFIGLGSTPSDRESVRNAAAKAASVAAELELGTVAWDLLTSGGDHLARDVVEGFALGSYRFEKYQTEDPKRAVRQLSLVTNNDSVDSVRAEGRRALEVAEATGFARDLVNLSPGDKTATDLARLASESAQAHGHTATVWDKKRIKKEGFGGLLAVNRGSSEPPTFTILEWNPENAENDQPIVLVGKGVVFDTGGLSLKPTLNSMDKMKYDMAGAAAVIGAMEAVARLELPLHVVGLVPATDNRPGFHAYVPGEVVHMHSGATVEVLNTDAEGRMILADALSYAKSLNPALVIDIATLTGAQVVALGTFAAAILANAGAMEAGRLDEMIAAGERCGDRVAPLPLWDSYKELLKSDVADIKNVGSRHAGTITAGKFLEHFVAYPWIHLDIAGPAFAETARGYRVKGGTGFGVRLFVEFLEGLVGPEAEDDDGED